MASKIELLVRCDEGLRKLNGALASSPVRWVLAHRPSLVRGAAQASQEAIDWLIVEGAQQATLEPLGDEVVAALLLGCNEGDLVPVATDAVDCGGPVDYSAGLAVRNELIREALHGALSDPVRSAWRR